MVIILVRIFFYEWTLEMEFIGNNLEILLSGFAKRHTEQRCSLFGPNIQNSEQKNCQKLTNSTDSLNTEQSEHQKFWNIPNRANSPFGEHLHFGYWGTLVTNIQMSPTDQCHQQHCYTLDVPLWSFFQNKWFDTSILRHLHSITSVWLILYESYRNCMRWENESFMKVDVSQGLLLNERHHVIYWNN